MADVLDARELLDQKLDQYRERGVSRVKLGLSDLDGVIRGKYVNLGKFISLMEKGGGFCDCVFGWDVDDQLYEGVETRYTGWHTGFPDAAYRLVVETERWLADEGCPYFVGEFIASDGAPHPLCPRARLGEVLTQLGRQGLTLRAGFEYEFFVFDETPHSIRDKGYRDLRPLTPGNFGYSMLRASSESERFNGLMEYCQSIDCDLEGLHCETGPGVWEAALKAREGVEAADRANLFKTFAKVFFARQDLIATFMAKWSMDYPGQSGHFHFSFLDEAGNNRFYDAGDASGMSLLQKQAVAGLERYLPEYLCLLAPTINSYTRLVKGAWAPTASTWGIENRTAAIRVIGGSPGSQRIECRVGGADANPYLVAAATVAAGLQGIEEDLDPDAPVAGNAYDAERSLPQERHFPGQLRTAAAALDASVSARSMLGDAFVDHFVATRLWECREHERAIDSWQLERYFEII
ncbi:MAG: glutamine synthetase family protein [Pseudomonadales bacterium]|jgi:glutamine synthetase|nr:glutamine synthetase family protein [Pseudomonadales bacterium]MDP6471045.1 glutamine synthetase family protein [Pseudomonadales bacterium]MDP6825769.1 glutamine synthetase family protein [Pseudomonadales bacterium]MDP6970237.1 glutamine synthetase family protein [Pseudomonadales bacterium]|tara:strand:- start:477 stop:1868 length:1392 start_codon:yes stop_codon:yes gene_type:complete